MNPEQQQTIHGLSEATREFSDTDLAEVLRPWDCYGQRWFDDRTALFRFDTDDVFVWSDEGITRCTIGAVDTTGPIATLPSILPVDPQVLPGELCLCWRRDEAFNGHIGTMARLEDLLGLLVRASPASLP